jgi:hypothetical protein
MRVRVLFFLFTVLIVTIAGMTSSMAQSKAVPLKARTKSDAFKGMMQIPETASAKERQKILQQIRAHPELYPPPVFYAMSSLLLEDDKKHEAAFWFYAGQLWARFDANRSGNDSANVIIGLLNAAYGEPINRYMFQDIAKLEELVSKVVAWDRKIPHNYDYRWFELGSTEGKTSTAASVPKEQWDEIAEKTRSDYLKDFQEVVKIKKTGGYYDTSEGHVIFHSPSGQHRVLEADAATFTDLGGGFGKDRQHVFSGNNTVIGADPVSFIVLGPDISKDAKAIYLGFSPCWTCDPRSLHKVDDRWYDKNGAYFAFLGSLKRIASADPQSVKQLNEYYFKDNQHVFYVEREIAGADPSSFKPESPSGCAVCGEDKNRCYWSGDPVPCEGKRPEEELGEQFVTEISPGMAVIGVADGLNFPLDYFLSTDERRRSGRYLIVLSGKRMLDLECRRADFQLESTATITVDVEAGRLYRLKRKAGAGCNVEIEPASMVQGRIDGPEIWIEMPGASRPKMEVELSPGKHTFTAVCREVTRTSVRKRSTEVELEVQPGEIYQLEGIFEPPVNDCRVWASLRRMP